MQTLARHLIFLLLMVLAPIALADSYVFVTNSTAETVEIEVQHTFSHTPLQQGSQWRQEAWEIPPFATKRVLAFNRNVGVKRNQHYHFNTQVKANDQTIHLQQSMTGRWVGSSIRHSAKAQDFNAPWHTDRSIHRYSSQWQNQASTMAFRAQFTGGYDDFHYTISNDTLAEPVAPADQLTVLSYNIFALPLVASDIGTRLQELPHYLRGYDVILLQEAFSADSPAFLRALAAEYPYQTEILRAPLNGVNVYNGGAAIVSRYPIAQTGYVVYPDCTGSDCFADKGFVYAEILKAGQSYHVLNTHAASFDTQAARQLRQQQFQLMRQYAMQQQIPASDALLFGGDFNVNKLIFADDYQQMLTNLNAWAPVSTGYSQSTFDPRVNYYASSYDVVEYLDYVVVSNDHRQPIAAENEVRVPRSNSNALFGRWDLSDHFPVLGQFQW